MITIVVADGGGLNEGLVISSDTGSCWAESLMNKFASHF